MDEMYQKEKHQIFMMWEIPGEIHTYTIKGKDNQPDKEVSEPFTVGKFYNMSLSDGAHLRTDLESWRSRPFTPKELEGFDPSHIVGAPCMINVVHKPKKAPKKGINAIVVSVTPMVKGMEAPPQVHPSVYFTLDDFNQQVFDGLSSGLKAYVVRSNEYREILAKQQQQQSYVGDPASQDEIDAAAGQPMDDGFGDIPF
jgi:hypothetical protein